MSKLTLLLFVFTLSISTSTFAKIKGPSMRDQKILVPGLVEQKQKDSMWCWAAVSRILLSAKLQNLPEQCEIVSTIQGQNCCQSKSVACAQPYNLERALTKLGYKVKTDKAIVDRTKHWSKQVDNLGWYKRVVNSIKNGTPVAITYYNSFGTQNNSSHVVVAYGTYRKGNQDNLIIYDSYTGEIKYMDQSYVTGSMAWAVTNTLE